MKNINKDDNNVIYYIVGKNIKRYRKMRKLTQSDLADMCNLSVGFISDLESNTFRTISLNTLYLISKKLNVSISKLVSDIER